MWEVESGDIVGVLDIVFSRGVSQTKSFPNMDWLGLSAFPPLAQIFADKPWANMLLLSANQMKSDGGMPCTRRQMAFSLAKVSVKKSNLNPFSLEPKTSS